MALNYSDKGIGLIEAIEQSGYSIMRLDGVWVSSDDAAVQAIIDAYVEPVPDLRPPQFAFLLALTGLDDVWEALEATLKSHDRAMYAQLYAQKWQSRFVFDVTMGMIGSFAPLVAQIAPQIDLSEEAIKAAWMTAHAQVL